MKTMSIKNDLKAYHFGKIVNLNDVDYSEPENVFLVIDTKNNPININTWEITYKQIPFTCLKFAKSKYTNRYQDYLINTNLIQLINEKNDYYKRKDYVDMDDDVNHDEKINQNEKKEEKELMNNKRIDTINVFNSHADDGNEHSELESEDEEEVSKKIKIIIGLMREKENEIYKDHEALPINKKSAENYSGLNRETILSNKTKAKEINKNEIVTKAEEINKNEIITKEKFMVLVSSTLHLMRKGVVKKNKYENVENINPQLTDSLINKLSRLYDYNYKPNLKIKDFSRKIRVQLESLIENHFNLIAIEEEGLFDDCFSD